MRFSKRGFRNWLKRRRTYAQIWIYFVCACVSVLMISTLFLYILSSNAILRGIGNYSEELLDNSAENTSFTMEWNVDYTQRSSVDSVIKSYALQSNDDGFQTYVVWNKLIKIKESNPYFESVYVVNDYSHTVVDTKYGISTTNNFYDQEILHLLQRGMKTSTQQLVVPRLLDPDFINPLQSRLISIIIPYEREKSISAFVVNINADALLSLYNKNSNQKGSDIYIIDKNNVIISSTRQSDFLKKFPDSNLIFQLVSKHGWFKYKFRESNQLIVYAEANFRGLNQWRIIETIPEANILGDIRHLQTITLIFFICLLVITLWIIWRLSIKIYSPIQELVMDVTTHYRGKATEDYNETNELSFLSKIFTEQNSRIEDYWRNQKFVGREALLRDLLESNTHRSLEKIQHLFKKYEIQLSAESLVIALFRIDKFHSFVTKYTDRDQHLLRFAMANIVKDHLQQFCPVETIDMGFDHIAVIFNVENEPNYFAFNNEIIQCQAFIKQYLSIESSAILGPFVENYLELHESYKETYELSNERFKLGFGTLITVNQIAENPNTEVKYPGEEERLLLQALKKGQEEQTFQYLQSFRNNLFKRSCSECKLSITYLILNLGKTLCQFPLQKFQTNDWNLSYIQSHIERLETMDAIYHWLNDTLKQTFEDLGTIRKSSKYTNLTNNIKNLIEDRLEDQNLSSKIISGQLSLSVNYIRNLFKAETNQSIMEYITDRRLEKVIKNLVNTSLSIDEIALQSGFTSTVSFYSIFKKKFGTTPALYRKEKRER